MFRKFRKAVGCIIAAAVMTVVSVTASADYIYDLNNTDLLDEIKATDYEIYGTEGRFTATLGDSTEEKYVSLRFKLFNEYLDQEFWESDDARVSVDVKLETAGKDVIACIPGFNNKWGWVNPSDYTPLKSGEWVTVTEKASHFHEEFAKGQPAYLLFQVRTNWGSPSQGEITVSVRNFRIIDSKTAQTTTENTTQTTTTTKPEETSAPEETSTTPEETSAPDAATAEPANTLETEGAAAETPATEQAGTKEQTEEAAVTEPTEPSDTSSTPAETAATTIRTAATEATSSEINYGQLYAEPESPVMLIVIIVGVAVVIVAGAIIGYMIYRKKKFY